MNKRISKKAKEVLYLLAQGGELKFQRTAGGYFRVISKNKTPWLRFHRKTLLYAINALYGEKLVSINEEADRVTTVAISPEGVVFVKERNAYSARPREWDRKWRLVFFDVPEEKKKKRDSFRYHLRKIGLTEFQRSGFISPWPCFREVGAIAESLGIKEHVVLMTAESLSNEFRFKEHFGLL